MKMVMVFVELAEKNSLFPTWIPVHTVINGFVQRTKKDMKDYLFAHLVIIVLKRKNKLMVEC